MEMHYTSLSSRVEGQFNKLFENTLRIMKEEGSISDEGLSNMEYTDIHHILSNNDATFNDLLMEITMRFICNNKDKRFKFDDYDSLKITNDNDGVSCVEIIKNLFRYIDFHRNLQDDLDAKIDVSNIPSFSKMNRILNEIIDFRTAGFKSGLLLDDIDDYVKTKKIGSFDDQELQSFKLFCETITNQTNLYRCTLMKVLDLCDERKCVDLTGISMNVYLYSTDIYLMVSEEFKNRKRNRKKTNK